MLISPSQLSLIPYFKELVIASFIKRPKGIAVSIPKFISMISMATFILLSVPFIDFTKYSLR